MPAAIGSVAQLVAVIRSQLAPRVELNSVTARANPRRAPRATAQAEKSRQLEAVLAQRIRSIERDDPRRGKKAFRIFLESVLLAHFGQQLINDPQFYQLAERVHDTMEADPELAAMIGTAIAHLTTDAGQA